VLQTHTGHGSAVLHNPQTCQNPAVLMCHGERQPVHTMELASILSAAR